MTEEQIADVFIDAIEDIIGDPFAITRSDVSIAAERAAAIIMEAMNA